MKRVASDALGPEPALKRVNSTLTEADDDLDKQGEHYILKAQNKRLAFEVKKGKVSTQQHEHFKTHLLKLV